MANNTYIQDYYESVKSGENLVCKELRQELENLIDDMDNPDFVFDTTEADRRIDFIENCIRLTKSPFYGKKMTLLLFQKAFITALYGFYMANDHTERFRRALFYLGRKNGKSELCSALLLTDFFIGGSGRDIVCSSNDDNQADILYQACDTMRLMVDPESLDSWRNQKGLRCLVNNNRIFKLSDKTRAKEGRNLDVACVDECFHPDTEVLTNEGWKRFSELNKSEKIAQYDNGVISFVTPLRYIENDYTGELVGTYVGRDSYVFTTPNHVMVYRNDGNEIESLAKNKVRYSDFLITSGQMVNECKHLTDFERVLIATQADASHHYKQRKNRNTWTNSRVSKGELYLIRIKKERKYKRFKEISKGLDVVELSPDSRFRAGFTYVLPNGTPDAKHLWECFDINDFDYTKANEFIDEVSEWDGYKGKSYIYYSSKIKQNADFVSAVAVLAGYTVTTGIEVDERSDNFSDMYRVYMRKIAKRGTSGRAIECHRKKIDYSGKVYCVEVPSHKIVVRNDKITFICGNCHEMKDNVIVKSIEQSQSLKENPKLILITTAGFVRDGFLDKEFTRGLKILHGEIQDDMSDRTLVWLYQMDSENEIWSGNRENRLWMKANPTLGVVKRYDYLEQQISLAKESKEDRGFVLTKDFNIPQLTSEAWLMSEDFSYEWEPFNPADFHNAVAVGGVDLSETTDLTSAKVILRRPNDPNKYLLSMYWIPEPKLDSKNSDQNAGARYADWQREELIRVDSGKNYINTTLVADWFYELYQKYHIRLYKCGYDVKFSQEFTDRMDDYGFDYEMVYQRPEVMSLPNKMVETDLKHRQIIGLNPVDRWCLSNCALKLDAKGYGLVVKIDGQDSRRIDGAVSLIIAYEMYRRYQSDIERYLQGVK